LWVVSCAMMKISNYLSSDVKICENVDNTETAQRH
jgi:hypothetical protein